MNRARNPFSAGRWVVGKQFFGRQPLLKAIIQSNEACDWIIGQRRVGKTSLLRQLEWHLNKENDDKFGLFWDIQGSFDANGLTESLIDAMEDSRDEFPEVWSSLSLVDYESQDCHVILKQISRALSGIGRVLFLLIDEAEEFMSVGQQDPMVLAKLRKFFQNGRQVHTILTSTPKLEQFHRTVSVHTSPLLHGFHARYLGPFDRLETHSLLTSGIESEEVREEIYLKTGGNPFEAQLVAKHFFEVPDLTSICQELEANPSLIQVLEVNFELLNPEEQDLLKDVFCGKSDRQSFESNSETAILAKLLQMGYLRISDRQEITVGSDFLSRWLGTKFDTVSTFHPQHEADPFLNKSHSSLFCRQIISVYKYFLETAQAGKIPKNNDPSHFRVSQFDNTIYPNKDNPQFSKCPDDLEAWQTAIRCTVSLIEKMVDPKDSWPIFRLCEMSASDFTKHSETDFLDLMLLIGEEASLDAD